MTDHYVDLATMDLGKVTFAKMKKFGTGGKYIAIHYNDLPFYYKSPVLSLPFGLSCWDGTKYSLNASTGGDPEHAILLEKLRAIEDLALQAAVTNSMEWFGSVKSRELLAPKMSSIVKVSEKYTPNVKFQINKDTRAFLSKTEEIDYTTIPKKSKVAVVGHLASVYVIANSTFGISNKAVHIKVTMPKDADDTAPKFEVDSDAEDEDEAEDQD